ncbi:peptidoglycan DD-metalloendopeptidase family protein [Rossellomorea aquimaris]|uniref:M23 family metallopeptidase n=1 Tax=Rossellomorea aquimaris TaxID=189382 RepID=UPI001CD4D8A3|nr:M23 family metallopeptidase [Rossellomorea aquimaris]MCA1054684.1 peptidoglycan DD-metalloendopeptidase family protein [Rossellomorea aquimaris]
MLLDYVRRFFIVLLLALCVSIMFLTGKEARAAADEGTSQWIFPVDGVITDLYGTRSGTHKGVDVGGKVGSPVYAVANGTVSKSYYSDTYGHVIFILHENGYETVYAHLSERSVEENERVEQGVTIGTVGSTGRSTGSHLHFEVHKGRWTIDKEHAVDPFELYGKGEVGQLVFAREHDPYQLMAVSIHTETEKNPTVTTERQRNGVYMVRSGDTLYSIAREHEMSLGDLLDLNELEMKDIIYPHQMLKVERGR